MRESRTQGGRGITVVMHHLNAHTSHTHACMHISRGSPTPPPVPPRGRAPHRRALDAAGTKSTSAYMAKLPPNNPMPPPYLSVDATTNQPQRQARVTSVNLKGIGHILLDLAHGLEGRDGRALFLGDGAAVKHLFMYRYVLSCLARSLSLALHPMFVVACACTHTLLYTHAT